MLFKSGWRPEYTTKIPTGFSSSVNIAGSRIIALIAPGNKGLDPLVGLVELGVVDSIVLVNLVTFGFTVLVLMNFHPLATNLLYSLFQEGFTKRARISETRLGSTFLPFLDSPVRVNRRVLYAYSFQVYFGSS